MMSDEVLRLKTELKVARNEIHNLRKQISTLGNKQRKDVLQIKQTLDRYCKSPNAELVELKKNLGSTKVKDNTPPSFEEDLIFKPIGKIRTVFPEKRGVPRQPTMGSRLSGYVELEKSVYSNPEHALEGLEQFSHLWIIYFFHRNEANTGKSKVAPPRLNGKRVGVFSTRSPHRPCAIGLSLVEISSIEGACVHFIGTDMVDGTPVLDIKPYIPRYDNPEEDLSTEDPEGDDSLVGLNPGLADIARTPVRVPDWINSKKEPLTVLFSDAAQQAVTNLNVDKQSITDVMSTDPRSRYLRRKFPSSSAFTFQLNEVVVNCQFDDSNQSVTIVQVKMSDQLSCDSAENTV